MEAHETTSDQPTGLLSSLGINSSLFIFQLINFALVVAVVWFLILKPVTKKMAERQKTIEESLNNAKKIEEKLRQGEKEYQSRVDEAKVAANKIMDQSTTQAREAGESLKAKAKIEIEQAVEQAKRVSWWRLVGVRGWCALFCLRSVFWPRSRQLPAT